MTTKLAFAPLLGDLKRRFPSSALINQIIQTFASRMVLAALSLFTSILIARALGPEGRGLYILAMTLTALIVEFCSIGLFTSYTYYASKDRALIPGLIGNSLIISLAAAIISTILILTINLLAPTLILINATLLTISIVAVPFLMAYRLMQTLLMALQNIHLLNIIEVTTKLIYAIMLGLLILSHHTTIELAYGMVVVITIAALFWTWRILEVRPASFPRPSVAVFKGSLSYSFRAYFSGILTFLVLRVDLFMVQRMLGNEATGYYSIVSSLVDAAYILPVVIGTILFPVLSAKESQNDKLILTKTVIIKSSMLMTVFIIFLTAASPYIIRTLYGEAFSNAIPAFIAISPGIFFLSINNICMSFLGSSGMPCINIITPGIAFASNILGNLFLIPMLGIVGASIASDISYFLMMTINLIYIFNKKEFIRD